METSCETVSEDGKVNMGRRIPNPVSIGSVMESERLQDKPTPIRPQQEAQGGSNPSQDVPTPTIVIPISPQGPQPPTTQEEARQCRAEHRDGIRLGVEIAALLVGTVGLFALIQTLGETREQVNVAKSTLQVAQRPYVSLGKADGTLVEYVPPPEGERKGALLVFFQNTGATPALSFLANVYSYWPLGPIEWELMKANKLEGSFTLGGNFEYCDQWGRLHCEMFSIHYERPPVGRFLAYTYECFIGFPPPLKRDDLGVSADIKVIILPPCEQPEEHNQND
jgi:hypothetical protein